MDFQKARLYLRTFDLKKLFREELGWDNYNTPIDLEVDGAAYRLQPIAQKRGVVALRCVSHNGIPSYATRRKIERQVAKAHREHFVVYTDSTETQQIWQWVRQEPGKPLASREHRYSKGQAGDSLLHKLEKIEFRLDEEDSIILVDVTSRVRTAFDVERTTKRFYDLFKRERDAFEKFLQGIPDEGLKRWYVSVMLNRLMFIYFIQRKGFLDGDTDYLRHKLVQSQVVGKDRYYREFLCPLFFEGFAKPAQQRTAEMNALLGNVPYLNGGIFQRHQVEQLHGQDIQAPDAAFSRLFDFFDGYQWYLDDRPLANDTEINPDVLGYIFEKYVNQKEMAAYYTKEDITDYISKNTIIPFLFDRARQDCRIAFEGDNSVWALLQADPDRYIYPAMQKGMSRELPPEIAVGKGDVSQRTLWNTPTPDEYALPTEIWRETVARRQRYEEVWLKLVSGEVREINDLITYNLDIQQFAQDVIENAEGPELLRAFWEAINSVTVLDPTCGSGAFLFAALNILESLYEACLERMRAFVDELPSDAPADRYGDFKQVLADIERHPSPKYFVYKSIIVNNLYGVDIMAEAVEIAKLRLFLKLVAQVERVEDVEPLPDIDFNIRAGNTLVGFTSLEDVERAIRGVGTKQERMLLLPEDEVLFAEIKTDAVYIERLFNSFHEMQTVHDGGVGAVDFAAVKTELSKCLGVLEDRLNRLLAQQYGVDPAKPQQFASWLKSHQPFHWFVGFYGIMSRGGFDVAIGNPPYLELREITYDPIGLDCLDTSAVHAMCVERSVALLRDKGCTSMIVPMALVSTQRMHKVQLILEGGRDVWYSNYAWRPGKLFDTVNRALTIFIAVHSKDPGTYSTNYQRWTSSTRSNIMSLVAYIHTPSKRPAFWVPKLGSYIELGLLNKVLEVRTTLRQFVGRSPHLVYYRTTGGLYWKVFTDFAPSFTLNGVASRSSRETSFGLISESLVRPAIAVLSSNVYWWWYTLTTNLRDLNPSDLMNFPVPESALRDSQLDVLGQDYLSDLKRNSKMQTRMQKRTGVTQTQMFKIQLSKSIIDSIDYILASHYGFTDEELDFIINYDIKYRMGDELFEDESEE